MDNDVASKFINSIVKNLQLLCHSDVNFNENVEIIGHLYLNVDSNSKYNYFVNEKVCKNDESSTVFVSNSFHAEPVKKPSLSETNDKSVSELKNVNKQPDQRKSWSNSRQRKTERISYGTSKNMDSFSDDDMSPVKQPKLSLEMPIQSDTRFVSSLFEKKVKSDFEQFNISFSNARVHQDNASQYSTSSPHLSNNKHLPVNSCIDLTDIKNEPSDNDDSEYIKSQQHIIDQGDTSYMTDDESLSTFSGSNEQILNLYTTAVSQNEPHCSLNNFTQLPLSANSDNSTHKMLFPPLPQTGPNSLSAKTRSLIPQVVRQAAEGLNLDWSNPPRLSQLTTSQAEMFFMSVQQQNVELYEHKKLMWFKLGEHLKNRRQYLLALKSGKMWGNKRYQKKN